SGASKPGAASSSVSSCHLMMVNPRAFASQAREFRCWRISLRYVARLLPEAPRELVLDPEDPVVPQGDRGIRIPWNPERSGRDCLTARQKHGTAAAGA